jgi:hypothetical protein
MAAMTGKCEKWQAAKIAKALYPSVNYLVRLRRRMEQVGFPLDDDLFRHVCAAYDAVNRLRLKAHNLSCGGTGGPSVIGRVPINPGSAKEGAAPSESAAP